MTAIVSICCSSPLMSQPFLTFWWPLLMPLICTHTHTDTHNIMQQISPLRWTKAAFILARFWGKRIRTYWLSVEKVPFRLFIYTNPTKNTMKTTNFESGNKSVHFENGTTLYLKFSSCKQQKQFKTSKACYWHVIFTLSCIEPHPMITRLLVLPFSGYSFNPFLAQGNKLV